MIESGVFKEQMCTSSNTFSIVEELNTGTWCRLFKAERQGQWWMLKCLKEEFCKEPLYREMLRKEYQILSRLYHPHIVKAVGIEDVPSLGQCIVMEYVDGTTLDEACLSKDEKIRVLNQLTEALSYIHSLQIAHRDLKPTNILVTSNGLNVKIIDFGLSDADSYVILKQPAGTRRYVSPEQQTDSVPDCRNDIYSLGIIMQEMKLGWRFCRVIRKATADMDHRYSTIDSMRQAINKCNTTSASMLIGNVLLLLLLIASTVFYLASKRTNIVTMPESEAYVNHVDVRAENSVIQDLAPQDGEQATVQIRPGERSSDANAPLTYQDVLKEAQNLLDAFMQSNGYDAVMHSDFTESNEFIKNAIDEENRIVKQLQSATSSVNCGQLPYDLSSYNLKKYIQPMLEAIEKSKRDE